MLVFAMLAMLSVTMYTVVAQGSFGGNESTFELEYFVQIDPVSGDVSVVAVSTTLTEPIKINNPVTGILEIVEPDSSTIRIHPGQRNVFIPGGPARVRGAITGHQTCWVEVENIDNREITNARLHVRGFTATGVTSFNATNPPRTHSGILPGRTWRENFTGAVPSLETVNVVLEGNNGHHFTLSGTLSR